MSLYQENKVTQMFDYNRFKDVKRVNSMYVSENDKCHLSPN